MTVMALMAVRRFALFTSRPRAPGSTTCNIADADDASVAVSVSGTSPVGCSSTEADGSATRLSAAWRRRACRSCRSTVCSATAPQKRSTRPSSPAVPRTRSRFWISPTDGSFLPFSTSDRCEDEQCTSLASASRLNLRAARSRRTSAPSSVRREVAGSSGFGGRPSRPAPPLGDEGWSCNVRHLPNFLRRWTENRRTSFRVPCRPLGTARTPEQYHLSGPFRSAREAPCSGTRRTNR